MGHIPFGIAPRVALTFLVFLGASPVSPWQSAPAIAGQVPDERAMDLLHRSIGRRDWLFVTTPSGRYELRVANLGADGLVQPSNRQGRQISPLISWSEVASIDRRHSRFRAGQVIGLAAGAILGGAVGGEIGNSAGKTEVSTVTGLVLGSALGTWLGGSVGDRLVSGRRVYTDTSTPLAAPSSPSTPPPGAAFSSPTTSFAPLDPVRALESVRARAKPGDLLRIRGEFGEFVGKAGSVDTSGFSALTADPKQDRVLPLPSEPLAWPAVARVDRRGNYGRPFAIAGALALGGLGGAFAGLIAGDMDGNVGGAVALGAVGGAAVGSALGALIGIAFPRWIRLVDRPDQTP